MKLVPLFAVFLLAGLLGVPRATLALMAGAPDVTEDVRCRIRAEATPGSLRLEAIAHARSDLAGNYRLSVTKRSASGTSRNLQSGDVDLVADRDTVLSTLVLDPTASGHYEATLIIEWGRGRVTCTSP